MISTARISAWCGTGKVLAWCAALAAGAAALSSTEPSTGLTKIEILSDGEIDRPAIMDLLLLKPGMAFSQDLLDRSLQRLALSLKFQSVRGSFDPQTRALQIEVGLLPLLGKVDIRLE